MRVVDMSFSLPDVVKDVAPSTAKNYKTFLNKLAVEGWDDVPALIKHQKEAAEHIKKNAKTFQQQRGWLSAVMYVLPEEYRVPGGPKTEYYKLFQESNEFSKKEWEKEKVKIEARKKQESK